MGLTNYNKERPILITGKHGTGKSTKARTFIENPVIVYANDIDLDIGSLPIERGIIIEDVHYKPDKETILDILRRYRGQIVLTSIDQKSVPKNILAMCKIKRAGNTNFLSKKCAEVAPNSEPPFSYERDTYSLCYEYLKESNRDLIKDLLLFNKPADTQILSWLCENMHPNKLIFVDGVVKRRWSQRYFYEMLAYAHQGNMVGRLNMPKRREYSKIPYLSRKLGVKNPVVLKQLLKDPDFKDYAKKKLTHAECRILKLGEKRKRKKTDPIEIEQKKLEDYFG